MPLDYTHKDNEKKVMEILLWFWSSSGAHFLHEEFMLLCYTEFSTQVRMEMETQVSG